MENLIDDCTQETPSESKIKSKTRYIYKKLTTEEYKRAPLRKIWHQSKHRTRTIIISRNGMLECRTNFKGTMEEGCKTCSVTDNEDHRLNDCKNWEQTNYRNHPYHANFNDIFSVDNDVLDRIIIDIEKVWDVKYANGGMRKSNA